MDITMCSREESEDENELLITKVVEYVEPMAAEELLCKFPDTSAFDFDYTQSSIWSPLVPRAYKSVNLDFDFGFDMVMKPLKRRLSFEMESKKMSFKNVSSRIKKKVFRTAFDMNLKIMMSVKKKVKGSEHNLNPPPSKGWTKVLKAASKRFKRQKNREPVVHVKL